MLGFPGFRQFCFRQLLQRGTAYIDPELNRISFVIDLWHFLMLIDAKISAVSEHLFFRSFKQLWNRRRVVDVGCGRLDLIDQSGIPVNANMPLEPKVPLVAFLRLVSVRVSCLLLVLGRRRRCHQR